MAPKAQLNVLIDQPLLQRLKQKASDEGRSVSSFVTRAIISALDSLPDPTSTEERLLQIERRLIEIENYKEDL